eukprot:Nitzschia sp. Nitz4//scaffold83_size84149//64695//65655//NITZ4_005183-RA/size84149-augustus-gene-0.35-mRNA-1//-1//CDS//3329558974//4211//frame0
MKSVSKAATRQQPVSSAKRLSFLAAGGVVLVYLLLMSGGSAPEEPTTNLRDGQIEHAMEAEKGDFSGNLDHTPTAGTDDYTDSSEFAEGKSDDYVELELEGEIADGIDYIQERLEDIKKESLIFYEGPIEERIEKTVNGTRNNLLELFEDSDIVKRSDISKLCKSLKKKLTNLTLEYLSDDIDELVLEEEEEIIADVNDEIDAAYEGEDPIEALEDIEQDVEDEEIDAAAELEDGIEVAVHDVEDNLPILAAGLVKDLLEALLLKRTGEEYVVTMKG